MLWGKTPLRIAVGPFYINRKKTKMQGQVRKEFINNIAIFRASAIAFVTIQWNERENIREVASSSFTAFFNRDFRSVFIL